ncbi:hypothetical protein TNCV_3145881 [Trichonephila clavipes]|nr:hypothetical protein TNCV_3145881 [Trichonephila clavipes]
MIVQFRNEKVSNHGSIPITIDCNVVAFIVFEEGFHQPIKRTKQRRIEEENGRTRTKLEYVTRARMEERRKKGAYQPQNAFEEHQERSGKEDAAAFFLCSWNEKENSLQGETYRRHSRCNEAGASFNADPSSDERQMHLNVVKCSN